MPGENPAVNLLGHIVHHATANAHDLAAVTESSSDGTFLDASYVDLQVRFIGASGLPKMEVGGLSDPYLVAKLDNKISFISSVKVNTLTPVWNELWKIKNVPANASLAVEVLNKTNTLNGHIGKFKTDISPGTKESAIEGPTLGHPRGTFWLKIDSTPSASENPKAHPFLFDGPIRFSRHFSPTVGLLTHLADDPLYSTWKMYVVGVPLFFGDHFQHWNRDYKAARSIFQGPASIIVRSGIQAGHHLLYARSTTNRFGVIDNPAEVLQILRTAGPYQPDDDDNPTSKFAKRIKPAVYTYIISAEDESFRFSETGAAFFVDFASKHALHSNCAETVRYSGEFHPRPAGGWENFSDDIPDDKVKWEVVIDNNSGTYSPDPKLLPALQQLLESNFPKLAIYALSYEDPELAKSRAACRAYAQKHRGVRQDQLQPHSLPGEITLSHQAFQAVSDENASVQ